MNIAQMMNAAKKKPVSGVSRRSFLASMSAAGSLVLMGKAHGQATAVAAATQADVDAFAPDFFVSISPDGTVTCLAHRSEMGTGIRTGLPRVVADELEADWDRVEIKQAIGDKRLGDQNTDGSNSIRFFFQRMRVAGATARTMLEQAAAGKWEVPAEQCYAEDHHVKHRGSNRSFGFGELVEAAKEIDVPEEADLKFKPREKWKYIGKDAPVVDLDDILTGKAIYGIDARMDNQLYAVVTRPPVVGGKVESLDSAAARKQPGVVDVVQIPTFKGAPVFQPLGGVAVLATSTAAALSARDMLKIKWDLGANADYDTDVFAAQLKATVAKKGKVYRAVGDADDAMAAADSDKVVKADYSVPHLSHAPMETPCGVADVHLDADGKVTGCHLLCATQNPQAVQQAVAPALGLEANDVIVNVTLLGAGFGRKSKPDYCVEAALLSKEMKRPVHVTWTREDDIAHDYFHTISAIHCEAAVDNDGMPTAWVQRSAYPTISSTFSEDASLPAEWEAEMGHTDLPFDIPNISLEVGSAAAKTRIGWLRSVCHIQQNFALSSFIDELATAARRDSYEYLLKLLGEDRLFDMKNAKLGNRGASEEEYPFDIGRLKKVLTRAAEAADWENRAGNMPKGRGLGIACARSFLGYTGHVVEVEVTKKGTVKIPKIWVSLDSGTIVSPDRVRAQLEGAAIMAATQAKFGKVEFKNGRAVQDNFDTYKMMRMDDAPREIIIDIVESKAPPSGVGETGVPSVAPAICNAIFAATGKRVRDLPYIDHDLSWS